jgi:RimJ/RimL family protein N-acetyltransferase
MFAFMPGSPLTSLDEAGAAIERIDARYQQTPGMGSFAAIDRNSNTIVGNALIRPLEAGPEVEVGYHIARIYWGNGYATEIAIGAVNYGFGQLGLDEIYGVVVPANIASRRVLEKAELTRIGPGRYYGLECDVMRVLRSAAPTASSSP